jgi:hypothetical protein
MIDLRIVAFAAMLMFVGVAIGYHTYRTADDIRIVKAFDYAVSETDSYLATHAEAKALSVQEVKSLAANRYLMAREPRLENADGDHGLSYRLKLGRLNGPQCRRLERYLAKVERFRGYVLNGRTTDVPPSGECDASVNSLSVVR